MKKNYYLMAILSIAMVVVGCKKESKNEPTPTPTPTEQVCNFMYAYSLDGTISADPETFETGDFNFVLVNQKDSAETMVAQVFASTASKSTSKIAGAYRVGEIGFYTYLYQNGQTYKCQDGGFYVVCVGDTTITIPGQTQTLKLPLYEIRAIQWEDANGNVFSFKARVPAMIIDKKKMDEGEEIYTIMCEDKKLNATDLKINYVAGVRDSTANRGYWIADLQDTLNMGAVLAVTGAKSMYGAVPSVNLASSFLYPLPTGADISLKEGYGVVYEEDKVIYYDFYLTTTADKVYHLTMKFLHYSYLYDSNKDADISVVTPHITYGKFGSYYYMTFDANNSEMTAGVSMMFFANSVDSQTGIPAGVYQINDSRQPGTMLASPGYDNWNATLTRSCAFTFGNQVLEAIWNMVSGIATVTKTEQQFTVTVNALNPNGKKVVVSFVAALQPTVAKRADMAPATPRMNMASSRMRMPLQLAE